MISNGEYYTVPNKNYANLWERFLAFIIDIIVFKVIQFALNAALTFLFILIKGINAPRIFYIIINLVFLWFYFAIMESSELQASPGKMFLGLVVSDLEGSRISFVRATLRFWAKPLSFITLLIGFIMIWFTKNKQGLHDIISGCLVIKIKKVHKK